MTMIEQDESAEIDRTVSLLGGKKTLKRNVGNRLEAHDLLEEGLPGDALDHLIKAVFLLHEQRHLEQCVGMSVRTWQRHKAEPTKRLNTEQSGRTWKFAEILVRATELLGSQEEAEQWLERPALALEQRKPIDLLSTPAGVETVEQLLTRLEFGVYT